MDRHAQPEASGLARDDLIGIIARSDNDEAIHGRQEYGMKNKESRITKNYKNKYG